jgi:glycerate 2-kinase
VKTQNDLRQQLTRIYRAAISAVDPALLVNAAMDGSLAESGDVPAKIAAAGRIFFLAIGKAALAMAREVERRLDGKIAGGLAVAPETSAAAPPLPNIRIVTGGHPLPDRFSVEAAEAALGMVREARPGDLLLMALSGGASAMFAVPAKGLTLEDKIAATSALLKSGASIRELNCVRKHLSAVKGGRLAAALSPQAGLISLILSDVPGDDVATIGSGLTAPDPTTFADAIAIMKRRRIWGRAPERVRDHLERGAAGEIGETPKGGDPCFADVANVVIGSNQTAVEGAAAEATRIGLSVERGRELRGESDDLGRELARDMIKLAAPGVCVVTGGEPSVTVRGNGRGGRAQQCALALALELDRTAPQASVAVLIAGSDGIDGPTDAAGAFVFPNSVARMRSAGVDPETALQRNDAYRAFDAVGDLFRVGPTGTNVTDLLIGLVNH